MRGLRASNVRPVRGAAVLAMLVWSVAAASASASPAYSLQGGCYRVVGLAGAEQVRLQATDLGRYLLYRPDATFVTAQGIRQVPGDWAVDAGAAGAYLARGGRVRAIATTRMRGSISE